MATSVTLPALGESVTEGTVTRWLKQPGDTVAVDEPLLEISTDKVDTEIPSPVAGTLLEIKVAEDETVEVGAELAVIGEEGETSGDGGSGGQEPAQAEAAPTQEAPSAEEAPPAEDAPAQVEAPAAEAPSEEAAPAAEAPAAEAAPASSGDGAGGSGESTPVTLPALGESVTEGTVTRWLKQPGDTVAVDEPLLEISTDKVDTEIPSPVAGTLLEIKVAEDETVEVGAVLALVGTAGGNGASAAPAPAAPAQESAPAQDEAPAQQAAPAPQQAAPAQAAPAEQPVPQAAQTQGPQATATQAPPSAPAPSAPAAAPSGNGATYVTPLVRKLAAEHNVDLGSVQGTGVGGRVRKQDVLAAAEAAKAAAAQPAPSAPAPAAQPAAAAESVEPSPLRGTTEKLTRMRKVIAKRVHESLQETAQLTTVIEIDITTLARLRDRLKGDFAQREGVKLSFLPFFAKAAVEALKAHPKINASIDVEKGEVTYHDRENLVIAVDTEQGLLVPVVKDAGDLNIAGLARKIAEVAEKARTGKLTPDEITGGTFTLTNTGSRGALFDTPIFFQPQVAILGTGAVVKRPMVIDDPNLGETIAVRHMVYFALSYDHRLIDGADAARFLGTVKKRLEGGAFEADLGV
ncbi:2-oxoglutarate dehydrogenase, E2 component, dihydrolipoamide succinyltransferase [Jiangella ureilytica]|uniref:Dihydrolipoamide acetyltransferase component of pyruvate dehydrogenase complex n=1 Tax=Jiangella ureilytica TaxID=2530374 RepID=A0A4R4RR65_9ACTN|nr:2-oxoglutarate dehydrogenase, E2 component, dihydrolipoamide succinyltransferase [Jiangella ureilytica]TDC51222.1 2-oxoglutarate dehydrogenase, E2 component, dihydrolipoamide succinyltransferase [Jiangella ureilytica]